VAAPQDRPPEPDRLAEGDQPAAWTRDDLRQRLEHLSPAHPSSLADKPERNLRSEVPRFQDAWAEHLRRWPEDQRDTTVDRSQNPEGSWQGDGNQYLNPDQHAQAKEVIEAVQGAEEHLTDRMATAAQENSRGCWLAGLEFRLKGEDRLKEKIADLAKNGAPDATIEELAREIPDAIRYTFCFEPDIYAAGYREVKQHLEASEYRMIYSKNHWPCDPEYKGVNTRWVTPGGQRFEVQFHTAESFHAKQEITHQAYERSRNPLTTRGERREIEAFQQEVCSYIAAPSEVDSILDYIDEDS
jgi:hypothetical protein